MKNKKNQDEKQEVETVEEAEVVEIIEGEEQDEVVVEPQQDIEVELTEAQQLAELLVKKEVEVKTNYDKWQRTLAEFDNFRKRTIKERAGMYESGAKEVIDKMLPVLDNFERALEHMKDTTQSEGVELIYKQLLNAFSDLGIVEIEAEGKAFDPNLHHAISHEENEEFGENQVIQVLQKGFIYKERVIRHSLVRVAN